MWCVRVSVVRQTDGATPLYVASLEGHVEVVRALAGAGAVVGQATVRAHWLARVCVGNSCLCRSKRVQLCVHEWCLRGEHGVGRCGVHAVQVV